MKKGVGRFSLRQLFYHTNGRMNKKAIEGLVLLIVFVVAAIGVGISLLGPGSPTGAVSLQQVSCCDFNPNDPQSNCGQGECCNQLSCGEGAFDGTCGPCSTTTTTTLTTGTSTTTTSTTSTTTTTFVICEPTTTTSTTTTTTSTSSTTTTNGNGGSTTTTSTTSSTTTTNGNGGSTTSTTTSTTATTGTLFSQSNGDCCGDGIENQPGEECDDGNNVDGDGCSATCQDEFCGDGFLDPDGADNAPGGGDDEECDDGNNIDGDGCNSVCEDEFCGDGTVQPGLGEQCEPPGSDPPLADGSICAEGEGCLSNCACDCNSNDDCDDDNVCTDNVCVSPVEGCDFPPVSCSDGNVCTVDSCDPESGCINILVPDCEPPPTGSGTAGAGGGGAVTCCVQPMFNGVLYDCKCVKNGIVQPKRCCAEPASAVCQNFCVPIGSPQVPGALPGSGFFGQLPVSQPSAGPPVAAVQEPSVETSSYARPVESFAQPPRSQPIVSSPTGAFDRFVNTNGAFIAGGLLILGLIVLAVVVVTRKPSGGSEGDFSNPYDNLKRKKR